MTALASTLSPSCGGSGGLRWPVILHRTPYGITAADAPDETDITKGMATEPRGTAARFDPAGMAQFAHWPRRLGSVNCNFAMHNRRGNGRASFQHGRILRSPRAELLRAGRDETNRAALDLTAA